MTLTVGAFHPSPSNTTTRTLKEPGPGKDTEESPYLDVIVLNVLSLLVTSTLVPGKPAYRLLTIRPEMDSSVTRRNQVELSW